MKNIERKEGKRRTVGRFALEIRGIISIVGRKKDPSLSSFNVQPIVSGIVAV